MAFGEVLFDEHAVSPKQPYLFNGKELDYETGLYYYGARYYDAKTSIFLNVDPLVEKTGTPYAYTYNNPINLIDPTGMEAEEVKNQDPPKNPRKAGSRPKGMSEEESLSKIITIDGKKYHENTGNIFAQVANKVNSWFGGDDDYFVEHKPYDPVEDRFMQEAVSQSAGALAGGMIFKAGGTVVKGLVGKKAVGVTTATAVSTTQTTGTSGLTTVGRWMSKAEYNIMLKTGRLVEGAGGQTFVTTGGPSSFTAAAKGSVYVEFQVSTKSLLQGGKDNWFKILGPSARPSQIHMLNKQGGELLPPVQNLSKILKTK